ncbi:MAG: TMEM175 family protein, partial [Solirubrobacterales bacterium]
SLSGRMGCVTSEGPPAHNEYPKGRLDAFTDGVLAIVITLLVLELKVPGVEETGELGNALADQWRDYAGYLVSFVFVGGVWVTHSTITSYMKRGDSLTFRLNLLLLFFVSLLPFLTALMTTHLGNEGENLAAALYGVDLFIASALITAFIRYVASQPALIADEF